MYAYIQIRAQRDSIATGPLGDMLSYGIFRQREADMVTGMYVCMYVCIYVCMYVVLMCYELVPLRYPPSYAIGVGWI